MGAQQDDDTKSSNAGDIGNADPHIPLVEIQSFVEKAKFYTSLCLGTTAILAVFGFLFLIPFVVEPAISTILADFSPHAVACVVTEHVYVEGLKNCSWASCREGSAIRCHQIKVNYSKLSYEDFNKKTAGTVPWDVADTKFFINTEGCGYPPRVNCSEFAKKFGYQNMGKIFPCYYSRTYPETVVSRYSWDENLRHLVLALVTPIVLFIVSLGVLCYWYCPPMGKSCGGPGRNLIDKYARKEDLEPLLQHSCGGRIRGRRRGVLIVTEGSPPSEGVTPDATTPESSLLHVLNFNDNNWPVIAN
ncbi:protein tipE [Fopius arisanus]|uniref:Protein tipE n=1 Tax=Fopius arisanus TaxID=64838 RepID=A0A9R1U7A4_9HYME|nr:PREDICTED: protein tipE [Fopius arisanus]